MKRPEARAEHDQLALAAGRGDLDAFAALYDATVEQVWGLAAEMVGGGRARAESIVEAVYAETWRTAPHFDPGQHTADRWVLAIAIRHLSARQEDGGGSGPCPPGSSAALHESLTAPQRRAVALARWSGHSHGEIDAHLRLSPGTTARRLREGMLALRDRLRQGEAQPAASAPSTA